MIKHRHTRTEYNNTFIFIHVTFYKEVNDLEQYLDYYRFYLESLYSSPHTRKQYWIDANQLVKYLSNTNGNIQTELKDILNNYRNELLKNYNSIASVNRKLYSLKVFLSFLQDRNVIRFIPEDILQPIDIEKKELKTLTYNQFNQLLNTSLSLYESTSDQPYKWVALRNFCIVLVIAKLGLKPSEVVRMKWSHFGKGEVKIIQSKGFREIEVSDSLLKWLQIYKEETIEINNIENDYVWLGIGNKKNEPITVKTIERIFQSLSNNVGFYVNATMLRYYVLENEWSGSQEEHLSELYKQFGYVRKSVLKERINRFSK